MPSRKDGDRMLLAAKDRHPPSRRPHRLPCEVYVGRVRVAFTICCTGSEPLFEQPVAVKAALEVLPPTLIRYETQNWVYVFMPNHLHLVVEGVSEKSDLLAFVTSFKQRSGYSFRRLGVAGGWQPSFYDYVLRSDHDLHKQIAYFLNNPVRKGLAENWRQWPFAGSLSFDLEDIIP